MKIATIPLRLSVIHREVAKRDVRITRAAVRSDWDVYTGWRHAQIMQYIREEQLMNWLSLSHKANQGFTCDEGFFWSREEAWKIVTGSGQLRPDRAGPGAPFFLLSEQLWDHEGKPWPEHMTISDILRPSGKL